MTIKDLRKKYKLTQKEASKITGIPLRTYKTYENDESKVGTIKYNYIIDKLKEFVLVDETHGILSLEEIMIGATEVFSNYPVEFAILFGSYAKGHASETSDVDILVSTDVSGLKFYDMAEKLRITLNKKIDLLDLKQLNENQELLKEILRDGIKIYVQK